MLRVVKLLGIGAALVVLVLAAGDVGQVGIAQQYQQVGCPPTQPFTYCSLSGHRDRVTSVAFSPDGRLLASGSDDDTIKLWDVGSGQEVRTLSGHTHYVYSVAFSPDGRLLASGSDDETIKLWDVASGQEVRTLSGHIWSVNSVAFSPDGQLLASGSWDGTIRLWYVGDLAFGPTVGPTVILVWTSRFAYGDWDNRVINFVQLIPSFRKCGILDNVDLVNRTGYYVDDFEIIVEGSYSLVEHYTDPRYQASFEQIPRDGYTVFRWGFSRDIPPGNFVHLGLWLWAPDCNIRIKSMTWTRYGSVIGKVPASGLQVDPSGQVVIVNDSDETLEIEEPMWVQVTQPLPLSALNAEELPSQLQEQGVELQPVPDMPSTVRLNPGQVVPLPKIFIQRPGAPGCPPEPNDHFDQASPITLPFFARCEINPDGENDFFRFHLAAPARVSIDVDAAKIGSKLDAIIILWDAWGRDIAYNDDYDGPDPFLEVWLDPGDYFIQVGPHGGHGSGFYELRVTAEGH